MRALSEPSRLAAAVFLLLVVATIGAFFVAQRLKQQPPLLRYRTSTEAFSPNGDGIKDSARIRFKLPEGDDVTITIKNGEGRYYADDRTLDLLEAEGRVVARYLDGNPNGSVRDIAGIANEDGNVVGLMPHPEHAVEALTGPGTEGLGFFTSVVEHLAARV